MTVESADMWEYWRDKHGYVNALKDYFPKTLKNDLKLQVAVVQLQGAEFLINSIMTDKRIEELDNG